MGALRIPRVLYQKSEAIVRTAPSRCRRKGAKPPLSEINGKLVKYEIMAEEKYHKRDIARWQLETAVRLFLRGMDRSSVITLAGASNTILERLCLNAGKEPFVDSVRRIQCELSGYTPSRISYNAKIDKHLGITAHKHLWADDSETVELDIENMAFDALVRALSNYVTLNGQDEHFVKAFFNWAWENKDGSAIMDKFMKAFERPKPR